MLLNGYLDEYRSIFSSLPTREYEDLPNSLNEPGNLLANRISFTGSSLIVDVPSRTQEGLHMQFGLDESP